MPTEVQIYKNATIIPADLSTGGPSWDTSGNVSISVSGGKFKGPLEGNVTGNATGLSDSPNVTVGSVSATTGSFSSTFTANGGVNTIYNPIGSNYNEGIRIPRANNSYTSLMLACNTTDSGSIAGQFNIIVYPSSVDSGAFAIRANGTDALKINTSGNATTINGTVTASSFKTSTASTGFLKADGTVDTITQAVPPGAVFHFAASSPPTGYLKANGDTVPDGNGEVQGVNANFSALHAILGSTYGAAGKLPDLRGEFIRGWVDDRVGVDTGTTFGRFQDWAIQNITGAYAGESRGSGSGAFANVAGGDGGYNGPGPGPTSWDFDASRVVKTSTETRPRNIALLACIKY